MINQNQLHGSISSDVRSTCDYYEEYEIEKVLCWLKEVCVTKVALQFPDELLADAADVALLIQKSSEVEVEILGDTSFGSCCVDTHAALKANADGVVHFGRACLSKNNQIPVLYILGKSKLDEEKILAFFQTTFRNEDQILVASDLKYHHATSCFMKRLCEHFSRSFYLEPVICSEVSANENTLTILGRKSCFPQNFGTDNFTVVYIGEEISTITNFSLTFNKCKLFNYNPTENAFSNETINVSQHLRKRYFCLQKAKEANLIGIVVATLGVTDYLKMIEHIKNLARLAGQKCYTFVVGKLNPQKLANFPEIDCFVIVACAENSLIDSKDFFRPIITPFEYEVALNTARFWTGDYVTDFRLLLPGEPEYIPFRSNSTDDEVSVSLISGKMRSVRINRDTALSTVGDSTALSQNAESSVSCLSATSDFFRQREWTGLQPLVGETPVTNAHLGKKGIASGYQTDSINFKDNPNLMPQ